MVQQNSYWKVLTRRKILPADGTETDTKLNRVLGLYDLTALGVGSTLGAGVYVLAGQIAKDQAGPSVMLSFLIAALASLLAGLCYAEFGARVPKAGSAYVYSYVCIGEFVAFVIGWNLILEYIIGTASVCRGISLYLDSLINDTLKTTFAEAAPIHVSFLSSYFDFFAFGLVIIFGVALAFGVETSAIVNNFCTCLNIFILLFVIIAGSLKADFSNWSIDATAVNATNIGSGGFFPFGFAGTLKGAATSFFGFVGFDCIATTGEEVRNPRKNIPRSILLSLLIIFLCYFGVSTVITLMVPYYMQDSNAPLPYAFEAVGWPVAMWIVSIGGLVGLFASLFGALFPLPRVMYSMAQDGLLFRILGKVNPRFQVPVTGSICAAFFTALIAGLFDLAQLVNLLSIGTLLAYSVVAISVSILRYMDNSDDLTRPQVPGEHTLTENSMLTSSGTRVTLKEIIAQLFNVRRAQHPNALSTRIVGTLLVIFCLLSLGIGLLLMYAYDDIVAYQTWALVLLSVMLLLVALALFAICLQPRESYTSIFRVPFVPIVPAISIFINIYLMLQLDVMTWVRFGIWMIIGLPIFIACCCMYDSRNPSKRNPERIAFLKVLRDPDDEPKKNGYLSTMGKVEANNNNNYTERYSGHISNEHSVRSLDEIHNLNDVGDDLIEVRSANGKVFYIEDTKSNTSTATMGKDENETKDESKTNQVGLVDDEKSVIAMLDDVLEAEDDGLASPAVNNYIFGRHYSVDSEMYPSVIETTIVATVHSSSSDSSEGHLEDVPEVIDENNLADWQDNYENRLALKEIINELLESDELWSKYDLRHRSLQDEEQNLKNSLSLKRVSSRMSVLSTGSVAADPLHSEKFKHKLSKIFMMPPSNPHSKSSKEMPEENSNSENRQSLKPSKSEMDLRQLVQKVTEHLHDDDDGDTKTDIATNIPRPPKFDPVLYNTINSLSARKERPPLLKSMTTVDDKSGSKQESPKIESSLPFKSKLEAILRRGPSHRTQLNPEVLARRPKSTHLDVEEDYSHDDNLSSQPQARSVGNLQILQRDYDAKDIIINARKSLKPVKEHTS